jgi:hypothetical protein
LPAGACATTEPRGGGQAPEAATGLGEVAGLATGAAEAGLATGLAAAVAGEAEAAAGDADAAAGLPAGLAASVGFAGAVGGEVGATAVVGEQAARIRPDQARSAERRVSRVMGLSDPREV